MSQLLVPCDHWGEPPYEYEGDESVIQHCEAGAALEDQAAWSVNGTGKASAHHASIVELRNGTILSVGRGHDIDGTMAIGLSMNGGYSFSAPKVTAYFRITQCAR